MILFILNRDSDTISVSFTFNFQFKKQFYPISIGLCLLFINSLFTLVCNCALKKKYLKKPAFSDAIRKRVHLDGAKNWRREKILPFNCFSLSLIVHFVCTGRSITSAQDGQWTVADFLSHRANTHTQTHLEMERRGSVDDKFVGDSVQSMWRNQRERI